MLITDPISCGSKPVDLLVASICTSSELEGSSPQGQTLWLWVEKAGNDGFCDKMRLDQRCIQLPLLLNLNLCFQYSKEDVVAKIMVNFVKT